MHVSRSWQGRWQRAWQRQLPQKLLLLEATRQPSGPLPLLLPAYTACFLPLSMLPCYPRPQAGPPKQVSPLCMEVEVFSG